MNRSTSLNRRIGHPGRDRRSGTERAFDPSSPYGLCSGKIELVVLLAIAVMLVLGALLTSGTHGSAPSLLSEKVKPGDSLWAIAARHPVDGLSTSQGVELLTSLNHLEGGSVLPGQTLLVPAEHSDERLASR